MIDVLPHPQPAWPLYLESPMRRLDAARRQSEVERAWLEGRLGEAGPDEGPPPPQPAA